MFSRNQSQSRKPESCKKQPTKTQSGRAGSSKAHRLAAAALILASTAQAEISGTYTARSVELILKESASEVTGALTINNQTFPLKGTVSGDRAQGKIDAGDSSFNFTATLAGSELELTSDGVTVRLTRSNSNPLHSIAAEPRAEAVSETQPEAPRADLAKLPSTFTHPLGFTIRHPANWRVRTADGVTALIPDDAPQLDGGPGEAHALAAMLAPPGVDLVERMQQEIAGAFPGMQQVYEPERRAGVITLRYKAESSIAATIRATVKNNLVIVMMSIGVEDSLKRHDQIAAAAFATVAPAPRAIDRAILGSWTNSSSYSSSGFTMASAKTYTLSADGTYTFSSQMAGGTADVGTDTSSADRGIWAAKDGTLTLVDAEGNAVTRTYRLVDGHLLTFDAANNRTIWSR